MTNLWVVFITGLTIGGLSCLAVQGGLLASVIASREEEVTTDKKRHALFATGAFLISKFIAYTLLGFLLGAFGGALNISNNVQTTMQLLAGLYMIAVALNLLDVHPIFRYAIIQPPRFVTRLVKNQSKSKDLFAPAFLGAMTIFIPCGTTLAMEALAISSANALTGALILATFILGTIPLFFGIGFVTSYLGDTFKKRFLKLAAIAVFYLGATSIYGSFVAFGWSGTDLNQKQPDTSAYRSELPVTQDVQIDITNDGYSPSYIRVKKGEEVTLKLVNKDAYSCAAAFRIPAYNISKNVLASHEEVVKFTPTEVGKVTFACSMGMYRGIIEVI